MKTWQDDLLRVARTAKCRFSSLETISNEAQARAAIAFFKAFGQNAACSILTEARTSNRFEHENARPADVLILHPELGVLFVEVKSWELDEITGIESGGTVHRRVNCKPESKDPWHQAAQASQQLQNATKRLVQNRNLMKNEIPFFDCLVAFPNITRVSWVNRGYGESLSSQEVLFAEDLAAPEALRTWLLRKLKLKAAYHLPCSRTQLDNVHRALGNSDVINRKRSAGKAVKLAETIDFSELQLDRFSNEQQALAESVWDGRPQLVRGVAGSGKTAVLVKNFVNMLDRKINAGQMTFSESLNQKRFLIVCFNRSLVPLLRQKCEDAFRELTYEDLPKCVDIYHMNGLEYALCRKSSWKIQYQEWPRPAPPNTAQLFAANYCRQLDTFAGADNQAFYALQYDAIYVDEGQDLFKEEFQLLTRLSRVDLHTGEKNIVIFYDDAQNLYGRPRPVWLDLGLEVRGRAEVMRTCLRNPKQVVEFAFNVLLGAAADTRVLTREFADTRFLKDDSLVEELPDRWLVHFAPRTDGALPTVELFSSRLEEMNWIVAKLDELINRIGIKSEDILLISEDPKSFLPSLEKKLLYKFPSIKRIVKPFSQYSKDKDTYLLEEGSLTLATVKAAKGYDCRIVLLIGAELFPNSVEGRASFYVAATRAKSRLFVTGLRTVNTLAEEAEKVAALLATPPIPAADINKVPALAALSTKALFKPLFRAGDTVMDLAPNRNRRIGRVITDAVAHTPPSRKGSFSIHQAVLVEFGGEIMTLILPPARLELFPIQLGAQSSG